MLNPPLFVIALDPQPHESGRVASKGFMRFEWPDKGVCVPLFTTEINGRQFFQQNRPTMNIGGQYIRDAQELADILEICRTDGDAQWAAVDPLELSDDSQCFPIQDAIEVLLKQDRDGHSNE